MSEITVIGSGVIGLSSALRLQHAGYQVRILTRDLPQFTTSVAAGAVWSGTDAFGKSRQWAAGTLKRFLPLTEQAGSGVTLQRMREVYAQPVADPWYRDLLPFFARVPQRIMPPHMQDGYLMDVPMVAPPLYLQNLHDEFAAKGGTMETRTVASLDELQNEAALLVNCTGVGAREVANDTEVFPIRGQTMLLEAPDIALGYMDNDAIDHIFPRGDGVLVGGVKVPGDWNRQLDPAVSADIISRVTKIEPSLRSANVLRQFVGLRPGRAEVRLEAERLSDSCTVIHNYGHGAVGYTYSWGCAGDVVAQVLQLSEATGNRDEAG